MRSYGHRQWHTLLLDVTVILIGTIGTISGQLPPYAQAVEELDRNAGSVARPR